MPEPSRKMRLPPPANEDEGVAVENDRRELPPLGDEEVAVVSSCMGNTDDAAAPLWRSSAVGRDDRTAALLEDAMTPRTADADAVAVAAACMAIELVTCSVESEARDNRSLLKQESMRRSQQVTPMVHVSGR